jgi:hypothetical protein
VTELEKIRANPVMSNREKIARIIFSKLNTDPDWDDGYEIPEQAAHCDEAEELSQQECFEIADAILAALE